MGNGQPQIQPTPTVPGPDNKRQEAKRRGQIKATGDGVGAMSLMEDYVSATLDPNVLKRTLGGQ